MPENEVPANGAAPTNTEVVDKALQIERAAQDAARAREADKEALLQAIDERFARLAKKLEGEKGDPDDPLSTLKDTDLKQVLAQGAEENPQRYAIAQEELWKRREKKIRSEIAAETDAKLDRERAIAQTVDKMRQRFGEDIVKEGSALRNRAQQHMQMIMREKGPGAAWDPSEQMRAAEAAHNDMLEEELKKARKDQAELSDYKKKAAMERGNQTYARPGEDAKQKLKKGDVDGALRSINLYERLFGGGA